MKGETIYSRKFPGSRGNHRNACRFDLTNGFLGITETNPSEPEHCERVLLSPIQVKALLTWLKRRGRT